MYMHFLTPQYIISLLGFYNNMKWTSLCIAKYYLYSIALVPELDSIECLSYSSLNQSLVIKHNTFSLLFCDFMNNSMTHIFITKSLNTHLII